MQAAKQRLPMDSRKRITLSRLLPEGNDVTSFEAYREGDRIILIPMTEVPAREAWLYQNPKALASVKRGLAKGKSHNRGSFAKHADNEV